MKCYTKIKNDNNVCISWLYVLLADNTYVDRIMLLTIVGNNLPIIHSTNFNVITRLMIMLICYEISLFYRNQISGETLGEAMLTNYYSNTYLYNIINYACINIFNQFTITYLI